MGLVSCCLPPEAYESSPGGAATSVSYLRGNGHPMSHNMDLGAKRPSVAGILGAVPLWMAGAGVQ